MNEHTRRELATRFTYHKPSGNQPERYTALREAAKCLAVDIVEMTPESREQSLALTKLEEAVFWANAAIARRENEVDQVMVTGTSTHTEPEPSYYNEEFVERVAAVAHEVNRAYCSSIGDHSQPHWSQAPEWQKESARAGVRAILDDPFTTPQDSHQNWLEHKLADGWTHGPVKDEIIKTHPCLVPWRELPREQRVKDELFVAVVQGFMLSLGGGK